MVDVTLQAKLRRPSSQNDCASTANPMSGCVCVFTLQHPLRPHPGLRPQPVAPSSADPPPHNCRKHAHSFSCVRLCDLQPSSLLCPWDSSGKNTGVGGHARLQGIIPTQGSNPGLWRLLHCRWILYPLSHQGSPTVGKLNTKFRPGSWDLQCPEDHVLFHPCSFRQLQP